ncbi:O-antigen ligase family protein [Bacillus sp. SM2101]|uniref:O-antigen ligase family protein n=1 Tax=Bacillus sp. SM2101 TaxID=2805366 RepID=UPI001BDEB1B2|nr:O-antigen ligase family protein [Bacillus sp. SM2101]
MVMISINDTKPAVALLFGYVMYFTLKPFYLFSSGSLQIADFILLATFGILLIGLNGKFLAPEPVMLILKVALFFCLYVVFINVIWGIINQEWSAYFKNSLFYIFNFFAMLMVVGLYKVYDVAFLRASALAVQLSIITQFLLFIIYGGFSSSRMVLFFNNPNQLGYYAILIAALLLALKAYVIYKPLYFISLFSSLVICLISLSKAAMLAYLLIFIPTLVKRFSMKNGKWIKTLFILLLIIIPIGVVFQDEIVNNPLTTNVVERINKIGQDKDDSLGGRGYDRIFNHINYLIFGAGEGLYDRFESQINKEIHSTIGNLVFSYGIVGLFIFIFIIFYIEKVEGFKNISSIIGLMFYGLFHNGIRNTMLWIFLMILLIIAVDLKRSKMNNVALK